MFVMSNLLALVNNEQEKRDSKNMLNGLPPPNTYIDDNSILSHPPINTHKSRPPPPPKPKSFTQSNHNIQDKTDKKELGTSDEYIDKQLQTLMSGLNIPSHARPSILALSKPQKLLMIQQYNRKQQNCKEIPNVTNVKRQNQPKQNNHLQAMNLIPILGKNISAPLITTGLAPAGTIPISEAQRRINALKRSKTPNSLAIKRSSDIIHKQKSTPSRIRHKKSKSNIAISKSKSPISKAPTSKRCSMNTLKTKLYAPTNIKVAKSDSCLPPPVPASIKQKYAQKSYISSNRSSIRSDISNGTVDEKIPIEMDEKLDENDDEYEYYDEYEEYEEFEPEPIKPDSPKPPTPKIIKK
eukprot:193266_1